MKGSTIMLLIAALYLISAAGAVQPCQFSISINVTPLYGRYSNISIGCILYTLSTCNASRFTGSFTLSNRNSNTAVYHTEIAANNTGNAEESCSLPRINTAALSPGYYTATVNLSSPFSSDSKSAKFMLLDPPNITLSNLSVSNAAAGMGSEISFSALIQNSGSLASKDTMIKINITGPKNYTIEEPVQNLSPGEKEWIMLEVGNLTTLPGQYSASLHVEYASDTAGASRSNAETEAYAVAAPAQENLSSLPEHPGTLTLTQYLHMQIPFFTYYSSDSVPLTTLYLQDAISVPENISITMPERFRNLLFLSAGSIYLSPSQGILLQALFNLSDRSTGIYAIPLNISIEANGIRTEGTQYLIYSVADATGSTEILSQTSVSDENATVQLRLHAPVKRSISNATLTAFLPANVVQSASQISTVSIPGSVSLINNSARLKWHINYIPAGSNMHLLYRISGADKRALIPYTPLLLTTTLSDPKDILNVVSMDVPTLYTNSTGQLHADVLYTGTSQQNVTFSLFSLEDIGINRYSQTIAAKPNQLLSAVFNITAANQTGTYVLNLAIAAGAAEINYTIPVFVIAKSEHVSNGATTTAPSNSTKKASMYENAEFGIFITAAFFIALLIGLLLTQLRSRMRLSALNAKELKAFREKSEWE